MWHTVNHPISNPRGVLTEGNHPQVDDAHGIIGVRGSEFCSEGLVGFLLLPLVFDLPCDVDGVFDARVCKLPIDQLPINKKLKERSSTW